MCVRGVILRLRRALRRLYGKSTIFNVVALQVLLTGRFNQLEHDLVKLAFMLPISVAKIYLYVFNKLVLSLTDPPPFNLFSLDI